MNDEKKSTAGVGSFVIRLAVNVVLYYPFDVSITDFLQRHHRINNKLESVCRIETKPFFSGTNDSFENNDENRRALVDGWAATEVLTCGAEQLESSVDASASSARESTPLSLDGDVKSRLSLYRGSLFDKWLRSKNISSCPSTTRRIDIKNGGFPHFGDDRYSRDL